MSRSLQQTVVIRNPQGFHMRPKAAFARLAGDYQCEVRVLWNGQTFDGKSMWALMGVAAEPGHSVTIEVTGPATTCGPWRTSRAACATTASSAPCARPAPARTSAPSSTAPTTERRPKDDG